MRLADMELSAKENFAKFLKNYAKQNDLFSVREVSKSLDISQESLLAYSLEKSLPNTITLLHLSKKLNVGIDELLGIDTPVAEEISSPAIKNIQVQVSRVIDGDTFCFIREEDDKEIKVRLIGVDTPESVHPKKEKNSKEGIIVSDYVKALIEGKTLEIRFDISQYDFYGRMLGYVYLEDGTFLNEHLLSIGYAKTANYAPNTKFKEYFKKVEEEYNAKENDD